MMIAMVALIVALPVLGTIPMHMEHAPVAAQVPYARYDYR